MSHNYWVETAIDDNAPQWLADGFSPVWAGQALLQDQPEASRHRALLNNAINIWRVDLSDATLDRQAATLSDDEHQRARKFVFDSDRNTFIRCRCALRRILARCLNQPANSLQFRYGEHGRPDLASPESASLHFNLSHSGTMALIAVAAGGRVGIDLNHLGQARQWQPIAKRNFSAAEQTLLFGLPEASRERVFYRIWSQKEAYTKALGTGFSYGFQNFTVLADDSDTAGLLSDDKQAQSVDDWHIVSLDAGRDWIAALAYNAPSLLKLRLWNFHYDND